MNSMVCRLKSSSDLTSFGGAFHSGRSVVVKELDDFIGTRRQPVRMFDVQGIEITAPRRKLFEFLRNPTNLPRWAHAFVSAGNGSARLKTPAGAVDVGLI
jgi:hypothetical protein